MPVCPHCPSTAAIPGPARPFTSRAAPAYAPGRCPGRPPPQRHNPGAQAHPGRGRLLLLGVSALLGGCQPEPSLPLHELLAFRLDTATPAACDGLRLAVGLDVNADRLLQDAETLAPLALCRSRQTPQGAVKGGAERVADEPGPWPERTTVRLEGIGPTEGCPSLAAWLQIDAGSFWGLERGLTHARTPEDLQRLVLCLAVPVGSTRPLPQATPWTHPWRGERGEAAGLWEISALSGETHAARSPAGPADGSTSTTPDAEAAPCNGPTLMMRRGSDVNRNGRLDPPEVDDTQLWCRPGTGMLTVSLPASPPRGQSLHLHLRLHDGAHRWQVVQQAGQRIQTDGAWQPAGPHGVAPTSWSAMGVSPDAGTVLLAGAAGVWLSRDGGLQWRETLPVSGLRWQQAVAADAARTLAISAQGEALYTSHDGGDSWQRRSTGWGWGALAMTGDGQLMLAVRHGRRLWISTDAGRQWRPTGPEGQWQAIAAARRRPVLAAIAGEAISPAANDGDRRHLTDQVPARLWTSDDGGRHWLAHALPSALATHPISHLSLSADGQTLALLTRGPQARVWLRRHAGEAFQALPQPPGAGVLQALQLSDRGESIQLMDREGQRWRSLDAGRQWQRLVAGTMPAQQAVLSADDLVGWQLDAEGQAHRSRPLSSPGREGGIAGATASAEDLRLSLVYGGTGLWSLRAAPRAQEGRREAGAWLR